MTRIRKSPYIIPEHDVLIIDGHLMILAIINSNSQMALINCYVLTGDKLDILHNCSGSRFHLQEIIHAVLA